MNRKEITTKEDLMTVINLLENAGITYWMDGGWGVDLLAGKQTRDHRDIDIDFDAQYTEKLLKILMEYGYEIDTDWAPARIELYSEKYGYLDIHLFSLNEDGSSKQADLEGGWYEFERDYFGSAVFEGKTIPCISVKGQKIFHSGYEPRDKDRHDMQVLENISKKQIQFMIDKIPAVLYGEASGKCFLSIHGKLGCKEEAAPFAEIAGAKGWQVLSIDLPEHGARKQEKGRFNPWCVAPELKMVLRYMQQHFKTIGLRADSIGAWLALQSFDGSEFERCLFVSPVLDMEKLIKNMMQWADVSEERLKTESLIPTEFGETLSWEYYEYAKAHPITGWRCRTDILYAGSDKMTARETVDEFVERFHSSLTVMENGEHWFHTPEQLAVLNQWAALRLAE